MNAISQLQELVEQMPSPSRNGMLIENIDKQQIDRAIAAIHAGGADYVARLVDMLGEPGSEADVKPRYALHALATHVLTLKDEAARRQFCETLCAKLDGARPTHVKAFLCEELGWAGRNESVAALGSLLRDEALCAAASMALAAIRDGAAAVLLAAWAEVKGKPRMHVLHALASLADPSLADTTSAEALAAALHDADREIRIAAAAGLAKLGDPRSVEPLLQAAGKAQGWERSQLTESCLVLAERCAAADSATARKVYAHLKESRTEASERHVREAADRGLVALGRS